MHDSPSGGAKGEARVSSQVALTEELVASLLDAVCFEASHPRMLWRHVVR